VRCYFQIVHKLIYCKKQLSGVERRKRKKQKQAAENDRLKKFKNWAFQWWWCLQGSTGRSLLIAV